MKFHHRPLRKSSLEEVARKNSAEFLTREPNDAPTPTPPKNCQNGRKESREEATQTADCGLPNIASNDRFPEFKSSMLAEVSTRNLKDLYEASELLESIESRNLQNLGNSGILRILESGLQKLENLQNR